MFQAALAGYFTALSLIVAIGAQNAFVLRQGLRREHVLAVVLFCAGSDAILISLGVSGFSLASEALPWLPDLLRWLGVVFLLVYGGLRFRAAAKGAEALVPAAAAPAALGKVLLTCALLTWPNPHVWLDTVVLIGSVSARYAPEGLSFAIGASLASFSFFMALGYGARLLAPIFAKPSAWVKLEIAVGILMWSIAAALIFG